MSARPWIGLCLRWLFFLASIAFLARFVGHTLATQGKFLPSLTAPGIAKAALAALSFASTAVFSALGWRGILEHLGQRRPRMAIGRVFFITQVAKYLPGNVGHHIGRMTLAKRSLGIPASATSASILQESALACLAALLTGLACFALQPAIRTIDDIDLRLVLGASIAAGLLALGSINAWKKARPVPRNRTIAWLLTMAPSWPSVASNLPFYFAITVLNGLAVALVASAIMPITAHDIVILAGAFALSWVIGFLLPGAPGGLGVREAAFVALLAHAYTPSALLAIALLCRLASVAADLLIFACGYALSRWPPATLQRR